MEALNIEVGDDVAEFYTACMADIGVTDPVATLIYGRFDDESEDHFRLALSERSELSLGPSGAGEIYSVPKLPGLYVPKGLVEGLRGKALSMENDVVVLTSCG